MKLNDTPPFKLGVNEKETAHRGDSLVVISECPKIAGSLKQCAGVDEE